MEHLNLNESDKNCSLWASTYEILTSWSLRWICPASSTSKWRSSWFKLSLSIFNYVSFFKLQHSSNSRPRKGYTNSSSPPDKRVVKFITHKRVYNFMILQLHDPTISWSYNFMIGFWGSTIYGLQHSRPIKREFDTYFKQCSKELISTVIEQYWLKCDKTTLMIHNI